MRFPVGTVVRVDSDPQGGGYYAENGMVGVIIGHNPFYGPVMSALLKEAVEDRYIRKGKDVKASVLKGKLAKEVISKRKELFFSKGQTFGSKGDTLCGSDPEIFVEDENGVVIPAWKYLPHKNEGQNAFWDGFQAEFNTKPEHCHGTFMNHLRSGLMSVLAAANAVNPKAKLTHKCVVDIPFDMMKATSDEHVALGCAPSMNAYDEKPLIVENPRMLPLRFAGCHFHWGMEPISKEVADKCAKDVDAVFGVMSVVVLRGLEDERRRQFYGKAGEYRLPPHGMEYRVGSSAVLISPYVANLCFDVSRCASYLSRSGQMDMWEAKPDTVRKVVNSLDVKGAQKILSENDKMFKAILATIYGFDTPGYTKALRLVDAGAKELVSLDIAENWRFRGDWSTHCCDLSKARF